MTFNFITFASALRALHEFVSLAWLPNIFQIYFKNVRSKKCCLQHSKTEFASFMAESQGFLKAMLEPFKTCHLKEYTRTHELQKHLNYIYGVMPDFSRFSYTTENVRQRIRYQDPKMFFFREWGDCLFGMART